MSVKNKGENPEAATRNAKDDRRKFLRQAGMLAGGLGMLSLAGLPSLAQGPTPDPNENCNFPFPGGNTPTPVPFQPTPASPARQRKSVWNLSTTEKNNLVAAYAALRALPDSDPRSWLSQAHVHCWYCSGSGGNPSSIEIHGSWSFFPWHRSYLYYHERILGSLINDPTFALPYWDWDTAGHAVVPPLYAQATFNGQPNPLFDTVRGATTGSTPTLDEFFAHYEKPPIDVMARMAQDVDPEDFFGTPSNNPDSTGGNIEFGPHGLVHIWCGEPLFQNPNGTPDMGVLQTAARDPLFFLHHCNIDRLWDVYLNMPATPPHTNPTECAWGEMPWQFYDEQQQWRNITASDVVDTQNSLGYVYQSPQGGSQLTKNLRTFAQTGALTTAAQGRTKQTPEPTTKEIVVPSDVHRDIRLSAPQTKAKRRYILHVNGIDVPANESAIVKVFVNLPTATAATPTSSKNYVGYFTVVPKTLQPGAHNHKLLNVTFDVTQELRDTLKPGAKLTVTLVPVRGLRSKPAPGAINLTYEKVYITTK